jgi:hypothetical protein
LLCLAAFFLGLPAAEAVSAAAAAVVCGASLRGADGPLLL